MTTDYDKRCLICKRNATFLIMHLHFKSKKYLCSECVIGFLKGYVFDEKGNIR